MAGRSGKHYPADTGFDFEQPTGELGERLGLLRRKIEESGSPLLDDE